MTNLLILKIVTKKDLQNTKFGLPNERASGNGFLK